VSAGHGVEKDVTSIVDRLNRIQAEHEAARRADEPAITFGADGDHQIVFRDQAALDEYVAGAILEHSRYHGGGVDECSSDPASPCARTRPLPPAESTS
jgi:hypothetical protein